jgi:hypothetical protein
MEWFAFKVKLDADGALDMENGSYPEANFNTFHESLIHVFGVVTGDTWSPKYYRYYRATGGITASFFYISLTVLG